MKLIYLKNFNEAYSDECSFETFKEILFDLSDDYSCEFTDYSKDDNDPFYDCQLSLPKVISIESTNDILNDVVSPFDDPQRMYDFDHIIDEINSEQSKIESLRDNINEMVERNKKLREIFNTLKDHVIPRLQSFSNCHQISLGYENDLLRICFDLKNDEN